jgi:Bifunctional DNA primase/polymerase, N-terminal
MTRDERGVFASTAGVYLRAGWSAILPVPVAAKSPPPAGFTGAAGADTSLEQLEAWATTGYGARSIALRMPEGVVGLDVDDYVKGETVKGGAGTVAAHEALWGPLPSTWVSTARGSDVGRGRARSGSTACPRVATPRCSAPALR